MHHAHRESFASAKDDFRHYALGPNVIWLIYVYHLGLCQSMALTNARARARLIKIILPDYLLRVIANIISSNINLVMLCAVKFRLVFLAAVGQKFVEYALHPNGFKI